MRKLDNSEFILQSKHVKLIEAYYSLTLTWNSLVLFEVNTKRDIKNAIFKKKIYFYLSLCFRTTYKGLSSYSGAEHKIINTVYLIKCLPRPWDKSPSLRVTP